LVLEIWTLAHGMSGTALTKIQNGNSDVYHCLLYLIALMLDVKMTSLHYRWQTHVMQRLSAC